MSEIHPTACVDRRAELGRDVFVGPLCVVGPGVTLGDNCRLIANVTLLGPAVFGHDNTFYPYAVLGSAPQDLKYKGGPTRLIVGAQNSFREHATAHRGTELDPRSGGDTRIGDHNLLMCGVHVAHDCQLGNNLIIANYVQMAGHCAIEDRVVIGGSSALHHFVTVGRNAYVGGFTRITHDVPPFMKVIGYDQEVRAVNTTGMQRWRVRPESIQAVKQAFKLLYARRGSRSPGRSYAALREIESNGMTRDECVAYLVEFLRRKLEIGVFGRMREAARADTQSDRDDFYRFGLGMQESRNA